MNKYITTTLDVQNNYWNLVHNSENLKQAIKAGKRYAKEVNDIWISTRRIRKNENLPF